VVKIESDSIAMSQALRSLVALCEKSGAKFHPALTIQYHNGDLRVTCKIPVNGQFALLNKSSLISVKSEYFYLNNNKLLLKENAETGWSGLQHDIAEVMFSIFNDCNKIKQTKNTSFWLTKDEHKELCAHISFARNIELDDKRFLNKSKSQDEQAQAIIESFFNSRVLGLSNGGQEKQRVIMPVIDYLNHHWQGSPFNYQALDAPDYLSVDCVQPVTKSDECFAFYSAMDGLDSYVKYGFADLNAPVVRSVPLDINLKNVGTLHISGYISKSVQQKSLGNFGNIPKQVPQIGEVIEGKYIKLSHIFIPGPNTPYAMQRILAALIRRVCIKRLDEQTLKSIIRLCEEKIINTNIEFYQKLKTLTASSILSELAEHQLAKIHLYQKIAFKKAKSIWI